MEPESCIVLEKVLNFETPSDTLVLLGQIHRCGVSLVPEPKPARQRWKDPPVEDDNYAFWPKCVDDSENEINNADDNICRFHVEKGIQGPNSCFSRLSVQRGPERGVVKVCSSIAKIAMIRTRFHTHALVLGGLLTMFGMTDLPLPYRSSSDDVTGARAPSC
jgi:hypothetical protein